MATTTRPPRDDERTPSAAPTLERGSDLPPPVETMPAVDGAATPSAAAPPATVASSVMSSPAAATSPAASASPAPSAQPSPRAVPPAPGRAAAPGRAPAALDELPPRRRAWLRWLLLTPILLIVLGVGLTLGYRYWYESTYFVATDNAQITGDLVQVGSMNAGRIVASRLEVGAPVRGGQELAVVAMPQQVGSTMAGAAPRMDVVATTDMLVSVQSPVDGVVAARTGFVGATVAAGQPIYMIVDPRKVWIRANIEESKVWMVQPGQPVTIHVDALNRDITGRVTSITPASAATFSLLPTGNVSGNFVKVTQYVPVKIQADDIDTILPLGTSVEVRIQIRQPSEEFPLPWRQ